MILPVYILTLGLSGAVVGVFGRRLLAQQGFVPDFDTGLVVTVGVALAYATVQLGHMCIMRLVMPTRRNGPLFAEALSHAAALLLIPYLMGWSLPLEDWLGPRIGGLVLRVEPMLYLAAFAGAHVFFKLLALFTATQSPPAGHFGLLGWMAACGLCAYGTFLAFDEWRGSLSSTRVALERAVAPHAVDDVHTEAQPLPEDAYLNFPVAGNTEAYLVFYWAAPPDEDMPPETIYATVEVDGTVGNAFVEEVRLDAQGWSMLRIPPGGLPADAQQITISWSEEEEPAWMTQTGLRPVDSAGKTMLLSGPWFHTPSEAAEGPSILLVLVEGLAAEHVGALGYPRKTTPNLDQWANEAVSYVYTFTPTPELEAATMTLFTGLSPLVHGYLGRYEGPPPKEVRTLPQVLQDKGYACVAFTQGNTPLGGDLVFDSVFGQGFELFDGRYPTEQAEPAGPAPTPNPEPPAPLGSYLTLKKAADWIEARHEASYFAFIRLRELVSPQPIARYEKTFVQREEPWPINVYDTALADVDRELGAFFERLDDTGALDNTCVIVSSPYGLDFVGGGPSEGGRYLTEPSLRVPLFIRAPDTVARERRGIASLEDLPSLLLDLAGTAFPYQSADISLGTYRGGDRTISMMGEPLALSLRTPAWRYTWQSGRNPFTLKRTGEARVLEFINMDRYRLGRAADNIARKPELADRFRETLEAYLQDHAPAGATEPKTTAQAAAPPQP